MSRPNQPANIVSETSKHLESGEPEPALNPGLLTLYSMRFCPFAQRTRLVLQHKQLPHQIVNVNLARKPDWFLAKSTSGKVPALLEPGGWTLAESLVTCDYLEEAHPESPDRLYPSDPRLRARMRLAIGKMGDSVIPAFYRWTSRTGDERKAEWEPLLSGLTQLQSELGDSKFFGGCDQVQMADLMIWPWMERLPVLCKLLGFQLPEDRLGKLLEWMERMEQQREVRETRIKDEAYAAFMESHLAKNPKYDGHD